MFIGLMFAYLPLLVCFLVVLNRHGWLYLTDGLAIPAAPKLTVAAAPATTATEAAATARSTNKAGAAESAAATA